MTKTNKTSNKTLLWTRRIARILSALIIIFVLITVSGYAVNWIITGTADPYAVEDYPFIENLPPAFIFLATLGLAIAWRFEKLGGIINLVFCLATLPILIIHWPVYQDPRFIAPYIVLVIVAIPGVLFLIYWHKSKENQK